MKSLFKTCGMAIYISFGHDTPCYSDVKCYQISEITRQISKLWKRNKTDLISCPSSLVLSPRGPNHTVSQVLRQAEVTKLLDPSVRLQGRKRYLNISPTTLSSLRLKVGRGCMVVMEEREGERRRKKEKLLSSYFRLRLNGLVEPVIFLWHPSQVFRRSLKLHKSTRQVSIFF